VNALRNCRFVKKTEDQSLVGVCVVNTQINAWPTDNTERRSAYEIYYGKQT